MLISGLPEPRSSRGKTDVAVQDDLQPAADGGSVDGAEKRLWGLPDLADEAVADLDPVAASPRHASPA